MRKLIPLVIALAACNPLHLDRQSRKEVSESVFRMSEDITVDPQSYCDDKGEDKDKCLEAVGKSAVFSWTGTGWIIEQGVGHSFIMTAGHMCESQDTYEYTEFSWFGPPVKYQFPILKAEYGMHGADGTDFGKATVIADDDVNDLCELSIPGNIGNPIHLADSDPDYSDHCYVVGAPHGIWGGGISTTFDAVFNGRGDLWGDKREALYFTGPSAGGASGSPVICDGKAVGVLTLGSRQWEMFSAVPYETVRSFHKSARFRK